MNTTLDSGPIVDGWRRDWDAMMSVYFPDGDRALWATHSGPDET